MKVRVELFEVLATCRAQVLGFIVLVSGTSLYNELMKPCLPGAFERRRRLRIDLQVLCDARSTRQQGPHAALARGLTRTHRVVYPENMFPTAAAWHCTVCDCKCHSSFNTCP